MKRRICRLFLIIVTLTAFAVPALAATVEKVAPLTPPTKPSPPAGSPAPAGVKAPPETAPKSGAIGLSAPTDNLSLIANRMQLKSKSLTTVITVPPNLPLTQPVTINIWYSSPAGSETPSRGQPYNPSTGNWFVHHDPEGDGKPRQLRMDITLSEPKPGGGLVRFNLQRQVNLDPLYDVTISPMRFALLTACDEFSDDDEIDFSWYDADNTYRKHDFDAPIRLKKGPDWVTINQFAWARAEVSASHNLNHPVYWFCDDDPRGVGPILGGGVACSPEWLRSLFGVHVSGPGSNGKLVPGKTKASAYVRGAVNLRRETFSNREPARNATGQQCQAHLQYTIEYLLRQYPDL